MTLAEETQLAAAARTWIADGTAQEVRERARLSYAEMGQLAGVTPRTVARWEAGTRPRFEEAVRYAQVLRTVMGWHLAETEAGREVALP